MSKGIELTLSQIEAYERGATMFIFPIDYKLNKKIDNVKTKAGIDCFIEIKAPIQKGDKNIQVRTQEYEIGLTDDEIHSMGCAYLGEQYQMTYDVIGKIEEIIDVKIIKVQDVPIKDLINILGEINLQSLLVEAHNNILGHFKEFYNQQLQEQNINRTYEDNDYIFLIKFKRINEDSK